MRAGSIGSAPRLAWRVMLAVLGGYALASAFAMALPPLLPLPLAQAILAAALLGFVVHVIAALWAFAEPDLTRVTAGIVLPTIGLAALGFALRTVGT